MMIMAKSNRLEPRLPQKLIRPKNGPKKGSKQSPELRPRRRASQTYFFKYQLARNPLKAEEEDLKLALLASLQECDDSTRDGDDSTTREGRDITPEDSPPPESDSSTEECDDDENDDTESCTDSNNNGSTNGKANKPETEDFLTFICLRTTAPTTYQNNNTINNSNNISINNNVVSNNNNNSNNHNTNSNPPSIATNGNVSPSKTPTLSIGNNLRRPIRQSPRLANSHQRKISESNDTSSTTTTHYPLNYEEEMKRASMALEDMAQEINNSNETEVAQKHLVKGLMTREFAGAFADEETIFESISNHKL